MMIADATGKTLDAMTVFSIALKHFRDHLLKSLSQQFLKVQNEDIHYVLTVPAIWDDDAKQFMMEAAKRVSRQQKLHFSILVIY